MVLQKLATFLEPVLEIEEAISGWEKDSAHRPRKLAFAHAKHFF